MVIHHRPAEDLNYEIEPSVQKELLKYPGKWAAMTSSEILAIRDTSTEAYRAALDAGVDSPILYQIPDSRHGFSYF